jgi:glycosyltransferase involved in cell wall biosynthesis
MESGHDIKIVHITTVPQTVGYFLMQHIRFAASRGAEVHVISSPGKTLTALSARAPFTPHGVPMPRAVSPLSDLRGLRAIQRCLDELRPTIVHAHTPKGGLLGMLAARICAVPVRLYHLHGLPLLTAHGLKRTLLRRCDQIACRAAHGVYCVSESLHSAAIEQRICSPRKATVLGHGSICGVDTVRQFDPSRYSEQRRRELRHALGFRDDDLVIGFVGRIVRDKGIEELRTAWQELRDRHFNLRLLFVGPFERRGSISASTRAALETDPRVRFVGHVSETTDYYAAMNVLAFPSHREGFGQVAIEAGAMEIPVVASRITGCVDAVRDGVTGRLVTPGRGGELAEALEQYLSDPRLRRAHGRAARDYVTRAFSAEQSCKLLWQEYLRHADPHRAPLGSAGDRRAA